MPVEVVGGGAQPNGKEIVGVLVGQVRHARSGCQVTQFDESDVDFGQRGDGRYFKSIQLFTDLGNFRHHEKSFLEKSSAEQCPCFKAYRRLRGVSGIPEEILCC
jgi:hypothetical protein